MKECGTCVALAVRFPSVLALPLSCVVPLSPIARRSLSLTLAATFMPPCSSHSRRSLHDTFSNGYPKFFELAFDVMKQSQGGHTCHGISRSRAHRHVIPHTRRPRGREGSDSLGRKVEIPLALHMRERR